MESRHVYTPLWCLWLLMCLQWQSWVSGDRDFPQECYHHCLTLPRAMNHTDTVRTWQCLSAYTSVSVTFFLTISAYPIMSKCWQSGLQMLLRHTMHYFWTNEMAKALCLLYNDTLWLCWHTNLNIVQYSQLTGEEQSEKLEKFKGNKQYRKVSSWKKVEKGCNESKFHTGSFVNIKEKPLTAGKFTFGAKHCYRSWRHWEQHQQSIKYKGKWFWWFSLALDGLLIWHTDVTDTVQLFIIGGVNTEF